MKKDFIYIVIHDPEQEGERCLARIHATKLENGVYIHKSFNRVLVKDSEESSHFILKECKPWIITDYRTGREIVRGNTKREAIDNLEDKRIEYIRCKTSSIYIRCLDEFNKLMDKRILEIEEYEGL